ncbi:MAG: indole-3-glycerol phosphate synthase TrpC [Nannocystaceae bacterium]|nr:indole-3-glycerol phosphate synthase TrpC [Nannocystaceae bacterium]
MSEPTTYLDRILAAKRSLLATGRHQGGNWTEAQLDAELAALPPCRDFAAALRQAVRPRVIAEFKRASPSLGPIRQGADAAAICSDYVRAGAVAVSVLADSHFDGSLEDVRQVSAAVSVPVLCKDFILDRRQILDARRAGADAVLLIVAALPAPSLRPLVEFAHRVGLAVLCEAHDPHEVDRALAAGARIIGGNARDLRTFAVDLQRAIALRKLVPPAFSYVAESGVHGPEQLQQLVDAGVDATLVGSALMSAEDPGAALASWLAAVR